MSEGWREYLDAARRKAEVAAYFSERLIDAHRDVKETSNPPPIPIQAFFEGVVVSSMAAVDQVGQAVNKALGLKLRPETLVNKAFTRAGMELPNIKKWFDDPLGVDLRRIRTRIVHYCYMKSPNPGKARWQVEMAGTPYEGSRELVNYSKAAAAYTAQLKELTIAIEEWLARSESYDQKSS
jgi:hypothetical protein